MADVQRLKKKAAEFEAKRQYERAIAIYDQIIGDSNSGPREQLVPLVNRCGDLHLRLGNSERALTLYEKAVDMYSALGFFNNAIALCNKILRHEPERSSIFYKLGKISAKKGFNSDAKQNFLEYSARMQRSGEMDEAFRALKEFADLCPGQDDVRLMLAEQLSRAERKTEALEQLQILHEQLVAEDRHAEAVAAAERIRALDPSTEPRRPTGPVQRSTDELVFLNLYEEPADGGTPLPPTSNVPGFETTSLAALPKARPLTPQEFGGIQLPSIEQAPTAEAERALIGLPLVDVVPAGEAPEPLTELSEPAQLTQRLEPEPLAQQLDPEQLAQLPDLQPLGELPEIGVPPVESEQPRTTPPFANLGAFPNSGIEGFEPTSPSFSEATPRAAPEPPAGALPNEEETALPTWADLARTLDDSAPSAQESSPPAQELSPPAQESWPPVQEPWPPVQEPWPLVQEPWPPVQESVPPATRSEEPSSTLSPREQGDGDLVDLGAELRAEAEPLSTRMVTHDEIPPEGEQRDFYELLEKFKQQVARNMEPEDYGSHYDLGVAFQQMGLLDEAIAQFQQALPGDSHRLPAYEALGESFVQKGQQEVAINLLNKALLEPDFEDRRGVAVLYQLGVAHEMAGNYAEAAGYYQRVLAVDIRFRDVGERLEGVSGAAR